MREDQRYFVQLFVKLVKLRRLRHLVLVHHEWRLDLLVPTLLEEVEAVRNECLVQVDSVVREEVTSMASNFRSYMRAIYDQPLS